VAPLCLALILFPLAARLRRDGKRIGRLLSALLLAMAALTVLSGCGVFSGALVHTSRTYTVTVAATSGALSHSTTFTLTVE
jgi:predicted PurR-regulated permease PerM